MRTLTKPRRWLRRGVRLAVAVALAGALGTAVAASADGGSYPSNAPTVGIGQTLTGGTSSVDNCSDGYVWQCAGHSETQYYRLPLTFGSKATFDFHAVAGSGVIVCVMAPSVTDYTVADANCLAEGETSDSTKFGELQYTAGQTASYLIAVSDFGSSDGGLTSTQGESWGYSLTTSAQQRSTPSIHLSGPRHAHVGRFITLSGTISPAISGPLALRSKSPAHGWINYARTTAHNGHFSFHYHLKHRGAHEFYVVFSGKGMYDPADSPMFHLKVR